ncbi:dynein axonemal intermediate chain 7 isoform X2 [Clinocottus analis]|uniref:dynein axonemal intermediate chain 7 isoform X2 n=1 Tax=Clinocottus analis TaxID=304258 RepID=UPI0035BFC767
MRMRFYGYPDAVEFFIFTMPPKKRKSKGRKLTKAQRAKQQHEEKERRLREQEEARLQAEKDEQDRLERERKEEELERLESKNLERREDELNELRHLLEDHHTAVSKWKTDAVEEAQWERYTNSGGIPDPAVQQDINTFISLWRDDPEVNIRPVLKQCNLALQLVEELEGLLRDVTTPQEGQRYQEGLVHLLELIHSKHLLTNEEILKRASANIDTETGNMQTVVKDDNITLCLWANLKKNPRFKGLTFEETGLSFNIPKQLAVSNVAVRILHTRYDHLSLLARMSLLRIDTPRHRSLAGGEEVPAGVDVPEQEETGGEVKEDNETQQHGRDEEVRDLDEEVQAIQRLDGSKSAASLQSIRNDAAESRESQIQTQMETLDAEDLTSPAVQPTTMDPSEHVQVVDLMQYTPLGGVFYYDAFHLPPQAHQANGWEIRQLLDKGLQLFPYPTERSNLEESEALACPPVGVSVTLPDSVVFLETPQVARWDAAGKQWRMDGITDSSYEEAECKISFSMESFHAFVLLQDTYANLPFQSWELRPLGQDSALFTINGALVDISITIQDNQCMLQSEREGGLAHLIGKWMSVPVLQSAMLNAGINIFVSEYTDKYVSTCGKDPLVEHAAYEQMALFAAACAFSRSKWNGNCGAEHLVMQVCEHLGPAPLPKDSWSLYMLGAPRSQKLAITENSEAFSSDHYPGSEFHSTFIHMLQDNMSPEGIATTRLSNYQFVDAVQSLLCAIRPLMYA